MVGVDLELRSAEFAHPGALELAPLEAFSNTVEEDLSETTVQELMKDSLGELRRKALADSADHRTTVERRALVRMRSRAVRFYVLQRANGKCEGCGATAPFTTMDGRPYLEPHHIRRLTDGGPDDPRWVAGICPNCHRRAHYSRDGLRTTRSSQKLFKF